MKPLSPAFTVSFSTTSVCARSKAVELRNRREQIRMEAQQLEYSKWSHQSLVDRVTDLERQLKEQTAKFVAPCISLGSY